MNESLLKPSFYLRNNVAQIAKDLIGKTIITNVDGRTVGGVITETEAYSGRNDKGCHANNGKRTPRTEIMYQNGGVVYMYLCYGVHWMLNIVTNELDFADAVLIRAIIPTIGVNHILHRRKLKKVNQNICVGPGKVGQALGLNKSQYGTSLQSNEVYIINTRNISTPKIIASKRIGIDYAGDDANKLWRFQLGNLHNFGPI